MLPGASIAPAIAWMPATCSRTSGCVSTRSARLVHGPSGTSVIGSSEPARVSARTATASDWGTSPIVARPLDPEEVVDTGAPLGREQAAVRPGLLPAAADRDVVRAKLAKEPRQVAHPGLAMGLAVAFDRDGPDVDGGFAQQRHDREHVVGRQVRVDDDRQGSAGRGGGLPPQRQTLSGSSSTARRSRRARREEQGNGAEGEPDPHRASLQR